MILAYDGASVRADDTYSALLVTLPSGNQYMPTTFVKNSAQARRLGVPVGSLAPIFVPPGQNPQQMVNQWSALGKLSLFGPGAYAGTNIDFAMTWAPASLGGQNDFKVSVSPIYDAYGNFEYGAN